MAEYEEDKLANGSDDEKGFIKPNCGQAGEAATLKRKPSSLIKEGLEA